MLDDYMSEEELVEDLKVKSQHLSSGVSATSFDLLNKYGRP